MKSFIYNMFFFSSETTKSVLRAILLSTQMPFAKTQARLQKGINAPIRAILPTVLLALTVALSHAQSCISWQTTLGEPTLDERATDIWFDKTTKTCWLSAYKSTISNNGFENKNACLMQFSILGELIQDFVIEDTANLFINAFTKSETGFILAGYRQVLDQPTEKKAWLAYFNGDSIQWAINKTYKSEINDVIVVPNQKIFTSGYLEQNEEGRKDIFVAQYNKEGNLIWEKTYGGAKDEDANSIIYNKDHLLIGASSASSNGDISQPIGGKDVWLLAINAKDGTLIREKNFGGTSNEVVAGLTVLPNGEIAVLAESLSTNGDISNSIGSGDFWLLKIDDAWEIVWEQSFGGFNADYPKAISSFSNGDMLIAGTTFSSNVNIPINYGFFDSWLAKIDNSNGAIIWSKVIGGNDADEIVALSIYDENQIIAAGNTDSYNIKCKKETDKHSNQNIWLLGLDALLLNTNETVLNEEALYNYTIQKPNLHLSNNSLQTVNILITDINGRTYFKGILKVAHQLHINFSNWQKGIYVLTYKNDLGVAEIKKIALF